MKDSTKTTMLEGMKKVIIDSVKGNDQDWEIVLVDTKKLTDPSEHQYSQTKLDIYVKELKKGSIFPPIVLSRNNEVIDGTHRLKANIKLRRKIPALRSIGWGTGKVVRDLVYEKIIKKHKELGLDTDFFVPSDDRPDCLGCGNVMQFRGPDDGSHVGGFKEGLPRGPLYYCTSCLIIVSKKSFIGWAAVKT